MTSVRSVVALARTLGLLACTSACHASFTSRAPARFVELDERSGRYDFRATTADGVVVAVRELDHEPQADLAFWTQAVENSMRLRGGYALIDARDVTIANGYPARQLRFGHDEVNHPHLYYVTLVVTKHAIYVLEAGGAKALVEARENDLGAFISGFRAEHCAPFPFAFLCSTLTSSDAPPASPAAPPAPPTSAPAPVRPK